MFKKLTLKLFLIPAILLFFTSTLFAQDPTKKEPKFGKISVPDLAKTASEKFPDAHAVVLFDYGYTSYAFSRVDGSLDRNYYRHVAIQFFDNSEFDQATFNIPLINNNRGDKEKTGKIKGYTYNLENGKYKREKLKKDDIFQEKVTDNYKVKKFTMPNVKEGSIIEIQYSINSYRFWNLPQWIFQKSIPTLYSEYNIEVPEFFIFTKNLLGYHSPHIKKIELKRLEGEYRVRKEGWVMTNLPAFESENFMRSYKNYLSRIDFEIQHIRYPSGREQSFTQSWKEVRNDLMENGSFGKQIKKGKVVRDIVNSVEGKNDDVHMNRLFQEIKKHMRWNGEEGLYSQKGIKKAWKEGTGNSADINLLLIATLKEAGFDVYPVVLSTRDNGMIPIASPTTDKLDYVLALVNIGEQSFFLDATQDHLPANFIPERCLNGNAIILGKTNAQQIQLESAHKFKSVNQTALKLTEEGDLEGTISKTKSGYAAADFREEVSGFGSEEKLIEDMQSKSEGLTIEEHTIENYLDIYKSIKEKYEVVIEEKVEEAGDLLYLNPMLYEKQEENPFKLESRKYPVDFIYPHEDTYMFQLEVPEGYTIESLPESATFSLEGKAATFSYSAKKVGKNITILSRLKIKKTLFIESEYPALKEFFNLIVKSHGEQIVLKKQ